MPDIDLDEADRCPHCGAILREPPNCCEEAGERYYGDWQPRVWDEVEYDIGGEG